MQGQHGNALERASGCDEYSGLDCTGVGGCEVVEMERAEIAATHERRQHTHERIWEMGQQAKHMVSTKLGWLEKEAKGCI